jgi:hypothetical protein
VVINIIILVIIGAYFIQAVVVILLMVIGGYFIDGY